MELYLYWMIVLLSILLSVSFLILLERKILGSVQLRKGPNVSLIFGLLHSISDAMKLFMKNYFFSSKSNKILYKISPLCLLLIGLLMWYFYPFNKGLFFSEMSLIVLMVLMSLTVFPFMLCGWASNSMYPMLGCVRSIAQVLSYEISMLLTLLCVCMFCESFSALEIIKFQDVYKNVFILFFSFILLFINLLAEMNRIPFDFSESESELVSGFNTEIGGFLFVMIFLTEYANILLMSSVLVVIFMPVSYMLLMIVLVSIFILILRGSLPRYRYDLLMMLSWKKLLPLNLVLFNIIIIMKYL
uniref:NADH-ubiquinone oxidoreductase chain 1 n=1 Tax=Sacculina sp. 'Beibu Gulf' TaxID=2861897 RepID=A0A8F9W8D5_9CRUS|nr:NADH dehydrogenase subunit 1 [Sacculina sp. 'Beibu Gulf']